MADDDRLKTLEDRLTRLEAVLTQRPGGAGAPRRQAALSSTRRRGAAAEAGAAAGEFARRHFPRPWSIPRPGGQAGDVRAGRPGRVPWSIPPRGQIPSSIPLRGQIPSSIRRPRRGAAR